MYMYVFKWCMCMCVLIPSNSVVKEYTKEVGPLPLSASGRPLQDVLSSSPRLQFVGSKPSSISLMLVNTHTTPAPQKTTVAPAPQRGTHTCTCKTGGYRTEAELIPQYLAGSTFNLQFTCTCISAIHIMHILFQA